MTYTYNEFVSFQEVISAEAPKERTFGASKAQRSLNPCTFTKDMLKNVEVSIFQQAITICVNFYRFYIDLKSLLFSVLFKYKGTKK